MLLFMILTLNCLGLPDIATLAKFLSKFSDGVSKNISYGRRDYESGDEKNQSYAISLNMTKKKKNLGSILRVKYIATVNIISSIIR